MLLPLPVAVFELASAENLPHQPVVLLVFVEICHKVYWGSGNSADSTVGFDSVVFSAIAFFQQAL